MGNSLRYKGIKAYPIEHGVGSGDGEKEDTGIEFRLMNVIPRRLFIVLFCIFFLQFRDNKWLNRHDEFLYT